MRLGHVAAHGCGLEVHAWGSDIGLVAVRIGRVPAPAAEPGRLPTDGIEITEPSEELKRLGAAIAAFLEGAALDWNGSLDARGLTDFQRAVFDAVRDIPHGGTSTYGAVARALGRPQAVRAVGNALHRNPFPLVVPCHRILREGGALGGFSCGVETKRRLLALEAGQIEIPLPGRERGGAAEDGP
jgi:methylated-DNA-[protein]-cysteine S-methyltransferase